MPGLVIQTFRGIIEKIKTNKKTLYKKQYNSCHHCCSLPKLLTRRRVAYNAFYDLFMFLFSLLPAQKKEKISENRAQMVFIYLSNKKIPSLCKQASLQKRLTLYPLDL